MSNITRKQLPVLIQLVTHRASLTKANRRLVQKFLRLSFFNLEIFSRPSIQNFSCIRVSTLENRFIIRNFSTQFSSKLNRFLLTNLRKNFITLDSKKITLPYSSFFLLLLNLLIRSQTKIEKLVARFYSTYPKGVD